MPRPRAGEVARWKWSEAKGVDQVRQSMWARGREAPGRRRRYRSVKDGAPRPARWWTQRPGGVVWAEAGLSSRVSRRRAATDGKNLGMPVCQTPLRPATVDSAAPYFSRAGAEPGKAPDSRDPAPWARADTGRAGPGRTGRHRVGSDLRRWGLRMRRSTGGVSFRGGRRTGAGSRPGRVEGGVTDFRARPVLGGDFGGVDSQRIAVSAVRAGGRRSRRRVTVEFCSQVHVVGQGRSGRLRGVSARPRHQRWTTRRSADPAATVRGRWLGAVGGAEDHPSSAVRRRRFGEQSRDRGRDRVSVWRGAGGRVDRREHQRRGSRALRNRSRTAFSDEATHLSMSSAPLIMCGQPAAGERSDDERLAAAGRTVQEHALGGCAGRSKVPGAAAAERFRSGPGAPPPCRHVVEGDRAGLSSSVASATVAGSRSPREQVLLLPRRGGLAVARWRWRRWLGRPHGRPRESGAQVTAT